jgi:thioredoxin
MMEKKGLPKSFDALINDSELPVLVDFWAEWCGPCRMVSPAIQRIASEFKGRLLTVKVNVDQKPHVAAAYSITSIPTIMLFRRGRVLMHRTGALSYESLKAEVSQHL